MDDVQRAQTGMHEKVNKVLTVNAAALAGVVQVAIKNGELKSQIDITLLKAGLSKADTTGEALDKSQVRNLLEKKMLKVGAACVAHFHSLGNLTMEKQVDFKKSELSLAADNDLYISAQLLFDIADPIKVSITAFNSGPTDVGELDTLKKNFFAHIQSPKLATEEKSEFNKEADESIMKANQICLELDIYMKVFEETEPVVYGIYVAARHQDVTGAHKSVLLLVEEVVPNGSIMNIDLSSLSIKGSNEAGLEVTGAVPLTIGFSTSPVLMPKQGLTVNPKSYVRVTFASLHYDAASAIYLNMVNNAGVPGEFSLEIF